MTGLHHTALKTSQMIECAASALAGQQRHGTKTHLNQAYGICRACLPVDETAGGAGLGLDIVQDIAQLYRGCLKIETSLLGGFYAVLELSATE